MPHFYFILGSYLTSAVILFVLWWFNVMTLKKLKQKLHRHPKYKNTQHHHEHNGH